MKKKRLFVLVLSLAVTVTMCFAGAESVFGASGNRTAKALSVDTAAATVISPGETITPATSDIDAAYSPASLVQGQTLVYPVRITANCKLHISYALSGVITTVNLYKDAACTSKVDDMYSPTNNDDYLTVYYPGTYYLAFTLKSVSQPASMKFEVQSIPLGGTLTSGQWFYGSDYHADEDSMAFYKVTVPSTGYLTVNMKDPTNQNESYDIQLLDSSKTKYYYMDYEGGRYEPVNEDNSYTTNIGVKKGTYYIAVNTSAPYYQIMATFHKVSLSATGAYKYYARSMKKGYSKRGVLAVSSSASNWYKITLNKKKTVRLYASTLTGRGGSCKEARLKVTVYKGNKVVKSRYFSYASPSGYVISKKLSKGTYYVKVSRYMGGNGWYSLTWK